MKVHKIERTQLIPAGIDMVWKFFSGAGNLQALTPGYMNFRILTDDMPEEVYPGQIITYKVSPLLGISLFWMTEITHVIEKKLFVDEQRVGPYSIWHHEHHFKEQEGSVLMTDRVHYQLPMYIFGQAAHSLFIKKQLTDIFDFRCQKIIEIFGEKVKQ